jgi:ribonuclease E
MELSRQRLRPSLFEVSTKICEICAGSGFVRTTESTALHVLRSIEEEGIRGRAAQLTVHAPSDVSLYMLNQKRDHLAEIEQRYGMRVFILGDETLVSPDCRITVDQTRTAQEIEEIEQELRRNAQNIPLPDDDDDVEEAEAVEAADVEDEEKPKERRPRRRRSRRRGEERKVEEDGDNMDADAAGGNMDTGAAGGHAEAEAGIVAGNGQDVTASGDGIGDGNGDGEEKTRRRRRGRRGGRRRRSGAEPADQVDATGATEGAGDGNNEADAAEPIAAAETTQDTLTVVERAGSMAGTDADQAAETAEFSATAKPLETSGFFSTAEAPAPIGFTASGMTNNEADDADRSAGTPAPEELAPAAAPEPAVEPETVAMAIPEPVEEQVADGDGEDAAPEQTEAEQADDAVEEPGKAKRRGWWQRGRLF